MSQGGQAFASLQGTGMVSGMGYYQYLCLFGTILAMWWCEGVALHLDDNSRLLIIQVTWSGGHQHRGINHKLKLLDSSVQFRHKGLCKKIKKWLGLYQPFLIHSVIGICLIVTNGLHCRHEGCFWHGNRYLPALSNDQINNLRGSCKPPQPKAAKLDLWGYAIFECPSRDAKIWYWGHGVILVATPRLWFTPGALFHSKWQWSLPL